MPIRAVFFDMGETLVDENRLWAAWADWLGVSHLTLFGVLGGAIERGEHHHRALEIVRPGIDPEKEQPIQAAAGVPSWPNRSDLYSDAVPCLESLRAEGYLVGVAGNQSSARSQQLLRELELPADIVAPRETWGVEKPSPQFFAGVAAAAGVSPKEIAYVGDRLDNDVLPAAAAGMLAVFLRRGPWGHLHALRPEIRRAAISLSSLDDLPAALRGYR